MAQLFPPSANALVRAALAGGALSLAALGAGLYEAGRSDFWTGVDTPLTQPVPFSHQHHAAGLGIDCRYCHTSVETSAFAGLPPTETCMTCHSQVWKDAPLLQPVRDSLQERRPLRWTRVHDLPDYVYFDHSIHVYKGVGCATCHGRVDQMALTAKRHDLQMRWCLDCHRDPARYLQPREEVFNLAYEPRKQSPAVRGALLAKNGVHPAGLTDCDRCHR